MARKSNTQKEVELMAEINLRMGAAETADSDNRQRWSEDMRFCYEPGAQWDAVALSRRQGRPCYSYNRIVAPVNQLVGDQRQQQPSIKIRAANSQAAAGTAEILEGLTRAIENASAASIIYNQQFKYAVAGGFGAWRVVSQYVDDDPDAGDSAFEQELRIRDIPNPLTVFFDPESTDPVKRDAMWVIIAETISLDKARAEYPGLEFTNFNVTRDELGNLPDTDVRFAEYYRKIAKRVKIAELSNGKVVVWNAETRAAIEEFNAAIDAEALAATEAQTMEVDGELGIEGTPIAAAPMESALGERITVVRDREAVRWSVEWYKVDGGQILEGPVEYPYKFIPVVRLPGRYVNIEGRQRLSSLIRDGKDSQRTYNYNRSTMVELVSLAPRAPYIVTDTMIKGYENEWNSANYTNRPYLRYQQDKNNPLVKPTREPPIEVSPGFAALAAADAEDLRATTGYHASALGMQDNATAGVAIDARNRESDVGSYEFIDNLKQALKFTGDILVDMIPSVYDTQRAVRLVGLDGNEILATINEPGGDRDNDLLKGGAYEVAVTIGPAYTTARQESLDTLMKLSQSIPQIANVAPDLIAKNLDVKGAAELEKRLRMGLIQQGIIEPTPEEAKRLPPPPQPDPLEEKAKAALVRRLEAQTVKDEASAQSEHADAIKASAEASEILQGTKFRAEMSKMMEDIIGKRMDTLTKANAFMLDPSTGTLQVRGTIGAEGEDPPPSNGAGKFRGA